MGLILEKLYKLVKELEYRSNDLNGLFNNKDGFSNWDAHVSSNLNALSNEVQKLKDILIEFDNYLNGADEFERKTLIGVRKEVRKGHYTEKS